MTASEISSRQLGHILDKAENETPLSAKDLSALLGLKDPFLQHLVFRTAKKLRVKYFRNKIFLYGFIYTSTICRNDCRFCFYRRSNRRGKRYRLMLPDIVSAAVELADAGVHLIDLTSGEDPAYFSGETDDGGPLCQQVAAVSDITGLPVMVSPGCVSEKLLRNLRASGASWFACYQESHTPRLFNALRPEQHFVARMQAKSRARSLGFLLEEGMLCGIGEAVSDIVRSLASMKNLDADQVRVMKFIPQPGTPMETHRPEKTCSDSMITAVLRLVFPNRLIPASLDIEGIAGLEKRLNAGANVVTSIVPPGAGLSGVARHALDIEEGNRTVAVVSKLLDRLHLRVASRQDYSDWMQNRYRATALFQDACPRVETTLKGY
jgi:methylornithine synthase